MERQVDVADLVRPSWPPLAHVRRGWDALSAAEQQEVSDRVAKVMAKHRWGHHNKDALLHFFTFLAQVETIAIEIPLRFLPHAPKDVQPLLRRQLVDEVFHSTLFARLAHELALPATQPPAPLASAEKLLDRIRNETDLALTATLLNLVAEGWIETLFKHALQWDISKPVFATVLADESRHVDEAPRYMQNMDLAKAAAAVHAFEEGMMAVSAEPTVALAIYDLAGPQRQQSLANDLYRQHRGHLREIGIEPSPAMMQMATAAEEMVGIEPPAMPQVVPDTNWRALARQVWQTPRDPTMTGDFDVAVGHVPKRLLTPVIIAALGAAWGKHPELNRIIARNQMWQLPTANVGVRVLLDDDELATVVITEADRRSVQDIRRMLMDGVAQLKAARKRQTQAPSLPPDVANLTPALPHMFAVAISNAGKWGVISGSGAFSGHVSATTDITVGLRRRLPKWKGFAYLPAWHVNIAAIQDHRVMDGRASATAFVSIQEALSKESVKEILARPDTLPPAEIPDYDELALTMPAEIRGLATVGFAGKYTPLVIGGIGLGAVAGLGGYLLYENMQKPPAPPASTRPGAVKKLAPPPVKPGTAPVRPASPGGPTPLAGKAAPKPPVKPGTGQASPGPAPAKSPGKAPAKAPVKTPPKAPAKPSSSGSPTKAPTKPKGGKK